MKKKLARVCLLVSPLVLGGAAFCLSDRDPITQANYDRIKPGMTYENVQAILGNGWILGVSFRGGTMLLWRGTRGTISVSFSGHPLWGDSGIANNAVFTPNSQTILERIKNWLGF